MLSEGFTLSSNETTEQVACPVISYLIPSLTKESAYKTEELKVQNEAAAVITKYFIMRI